MTKRILALIGILLVLGLIAVLLSQGKETQTSPSSAAVPSTGAVRQPHPLATLQESNADFTAGQKYQATGDYDNAIASFQKALAAVQDPTLDAVIEYYLAYTYDLKGDSADAVKTFKVIAQDNPGWPAIEAYALQSMGMMHYEHLDDQSITTAIFSDAPYSLFGPSTTTTVAMAYRDLFVHAASFFPLGASETRVAYWYANDLLTTERAATTSPQGIQDITMANESLAKAHASLAIADSDPSTQADAPETLSRMGLVEGIMAKMGVGDPQAAEDSFKQAMQAATAAKVLPGNEVAFYYAVFLGNYYGATRASDISTLLSPFAVGDAANIYKPMEHMLAVIRTDPNETSQRQWAVTLGKLDPSFKSYLISIGWQSSDFAT